MTHDVFRFIHAFEAFPEVMATINKQGFEKPSPIQSQAWPYLLSGKDMIGIAQTGTGKTLAFLMPAFIHIDCQPVGRDQRGGANVLVLCPTRELALQIEGEVAKYEYRYYKLRMNSSHMQTEYQKTSTEVSNPCASMAEVTERNR